MPNVKITMIDRLLSLVAPDLCSSCGKESSLFCDNCKSYIIRATLENCLVCGRGKRSPLCDSCHEVINRIYIVGLRKGGLANLIDTFKFKYQERAANILATLLYETLPHSRDLYIVPVPTTPSHIRQRGYDHTFLLAKALANKIGGRVVPTLISQKDITQHFSGRRQRYHQARDMFSFKEKLSPEHHYLLVDDIVTTGSTILAAAASLRAAGARIIDVAVIARQPLDSSPDIC